MTIPPWHIRCRRGRLHHQNLPVMLIAAGVAQQDFPEDRAEPVVLRAPVSAVALRVGFEHALRERLIWRAA